MTQFCSPESVTECRQITSAYFPHRWRVFWPDSQFVHFGYLILSSGCRLSPGRHTGWPAVVVTISAPHCSNLYIRHALICRHRPSDCTTGCTTTPVGLWPRCVSGCEEVWKYVVIGKVVESKQGAKIKVESAIVWVESIKSWSEISCSEKFEIVCVWILFMSYFPKNPNTTPNWSLLSLVHSFVALGG